MIGHKIISVDSDCIDGKLVKFQEKTDLHELRFFAKKRGQECSGVVMASVRAPTLYDAVLKMAKFIKESDIVDIHNSYR